MSNNTNTLFWIITGAVIVLSVFLLINPFGNRTLRTINNKFSSYLIEYKLKNTEYSTWDIEFVDSLADADEDKLNKVFVYNGELYIVKQEQSRESFEVGKTYEFNGMQFELNFPDDYIDIIHEYYDMGVLTSSQNYMFEANLHSGYYKGSQTTGNTIYLNYMSDWLFISFPNEQYDSKRVYEFSSGNLTNMKSFTSKYHLNFTITSLRDDFPFWEYITIVGDPVYTYVKI